MTLLPTLGLKPGHAGKVTVAGVADGFEAFVLSRIVAEAAADRPVLFIARDGQRLPAIRDGSSGALSSALDAQAPRRPHAVSTRWRR